MKRLFFLFTIISIVTACSNDDSIENPNPNNSENDNFKFLSTIISDPTEPRELPYKNIDTLVYKEGKLFKAYIGSFCSPGRIYQYEYGDNGKVSVVYAKTYNPHYGGGSAEFEEMINIFENSSLNENYDGKSIYEYNSDNKIKNIYGSSNDSDEENNTFTSSTEFKYNDNGHLYEMIGISNAPAPFGTSTIIFTATEFDDKNQPITVQANDSGEISEISYEYGEFKNPYYPLYEKYGIVIGCNIFLQDFITPYVVKIKQSSSSNQTYNYTSSDGKYPETINFVGVNGVTFIFDINYL